MAANLTKITAPYLADTIAPFRISALFAGATAIDVASPCYIADDGLVYMTNGSTVDEANHSAFDGICILGAVAGGPVTLHGLGTRIHVVASGLTIGARYWVSGTAGAISDTKVASADTPIAKAVSATDIRIVRSSY